jgi:hypothetical protein
MPSPNETMRAGWSCDSIEPEPQAASSSAEVDASASRARRIQLHTMKFSKLTG